MGAVDIAENVVDFMGTLAFLLVMISPLFDLRNRAKGKGE